MHVCDVCRFMKKALEDSTDILRKKRNVPCSVLEMWKLENSKSKEQVFLQPLTTGEYVLSFHSFTTFPLILRS